MLFYSLMVKPLILAVGAIPAFFAILIMVPMLTTPEIPISAINSNDTIEIEYTKHDLTTISFGVTEKTAATNTQILTINNDGAVKYNQIREGSDQSQITSSISNQQLQKLTALIKETGFMSIPKEPFPIMDDVGDYTKSTIKITLNGNETQIFWPNQDATEKLIPPIITMIESELEQIINQIIE
jgi:hypothetical protein